MSADFDASNYWGDRISSGELDETLLDQEDGEITLTEEELEMIEQALRRQFIAVKKDRHIVVSAALKVRRALR